MTQIKEQRQCVKTPEFPATGAFNAQSCGRTAESEHQPDSL